MNFHMRSSANTLLEKMDCCAKVWMRWALPGAAPFCACNHCTLDQGRPRARVGISRPLLPCPRQCKKPRRGRAGASADREYSTSIKTAAPSGVPRRVATPSRPPRMFGRRRRVRGAGRPAARPAVNRPRTPQLCREHLVNKRSKIRYGGRPRFDRWRFTWPKSQQTTPS
jgi:hypothetical protein